MAATTDSVSLSDLNPKTLSLIARYLLENDDSFSKFRPLAADVETAFLSHKVDGSWFETYSRPRY